VIHLLPSLHVGGVERGVIDLCTSTGAGHRPLVASSGGPLQATLPPHCIALRAATLARRDPVSVLLINPILLAIWSRRHCVGILHAHSRGLAVSARVARLLCWALAFEPRVRVIVTWHGYYDSASMVKRALCCVVLGAADALIFPSEALRRHVVRCYGPRVRPDASVIYRGIATPSPRAPPNPEDEALCPPLRLLLPGRLSRSKGHDLLILAARLLCSRHLLGVDGEGVGGGGMRGGGVDSGGVGGSGVGGVGVASAPPRVSVVMMGARPSQLARSGLASANASEAADTAATSLVVPSDIHDGTRQPGTHDAEDRTQDTAGARGQDIRRRQIMHDREASYATGQRTASSYERSLHRLIREATGHGAGGGGNTAGGRAGSAAGGREDSVTGGSNTAGEGSATGADAGAPHGHINNNTNTITTTTTTATTAAAAAASTTTTASTTTATAAAAVHSIDNNNNNGLQFSFEAHGALSAAFAACDVVVVPSRRPEAFGRVIVEAMAAGKLCVSFHHGAHI